VTTSVVASQILPSARRHGITDDDVRHAINNAIAAVNAPHQPDFVMLIGPSATLTLLEVGVLSAEDNHYVIHAMRARTRYLKMIEPREGGER
jgi:hypothetical protein